MKHVRKRLTYANVMSSIAVFLVLGGATAFAASTLGKNTVGSKQIKKEAVTPSKLSSAAKQTLTGPKGATGVQGVAGAKGDKGEKGDKGDKGERGLTGEAGSALAFASIQSDGTVEVEFSKGIAQANIEVPATGIYCISGLGFTPKVAIASPNAVGPEDGILANPVVKAPSNNLSGCGAGAQVRIHMTTAAAPTTLTNHPFYIILD